MKMSYFHIALMIFAVGINSISGDRVSSEEACKEASSVLELVMFFPVSICGQNTDFVGPGRDWINSLTVYSQALTQLVKSYKSNIDQVRFKSFKLFLQDISHLAQQIRTQITSHVTKYIAFVSEKVQKVAEKFKGILHNTRKTLSDSTTKIGNVAGRTVNKTMPYFSKISTTWQFTGTLLLGLGDMTMAFKACIMTVLDECLTAITCSPCLYVRYAFAGILLLSLPFSFYKIVTEKPEKWPQRKTDKISPRKGKENTKNKLHEATDSWSNLLNLGQISYFTGYIFSSNEGHFDEEKDQILSLLHYRMCEIYDGNDCNCGGRTRPIGDLRSDRVTRFKLKPENFGNMACNCGGFSRKSYVAVHTPRTCYTDIATNTISNDTTEKEQQVHNPLVDEKMVLEMSIKDGEHLVEQYEITNQELNGTSLLTEVSMVEDIERIENEIGHPKFNSSFIDNSPYASTLSDSAYSDRASGDGPMLVITRRSPRKECGISFTEDDSMSYLDDSATEHDGSLLDMSDINKSLSFNSGDGVYEFVIMCALQTIFRTAKRLFQTRRPRQLNESQTSIGDLSQDTFFVISRRKSRSRQNKQRLNTNQSATVKDEDELENATNESITDGSLTDYDRVSDVSAYGDISEHDVRIELESWSISSSSDCISVSRSLDNVNDPFSRKTCLNDVIL